MFTIIHMHSWSICIKNSCHANINFFLKKKRFIIISVILNKHCLQKILCMRHMCNVSYYILYHTCFLYSYILALPLSYRSDDITLLLSTDLASKGVVGSKLNQVFEEFVMKNFFLGHKHLMIKQKTKNNA